MMLLSNPSVKTLKSLQLPALNDNLITRRTVVVIHDKKPLLMIKWGVSFKGTMQHVVIKMQSITDMYNVTFTNKGKANVLKSAFESVGFRFATSNEDLIIKALMREFYTINDYFIIEL